MLGLCVQCVHFDSFRRQPPSAGPILLERERAENTKKRERERKSGVCLSGNEDA